MPRSRLLMAWPVDHRAQCGPHETAIPISHHRASLGISGYSKSRTLAAAAPLQFAALDEGQPRRSKREPDLYSSGGPPLAHRAGSGNSVRTAGASHVEFVPLVGLAIRISLPVWPAALTLWGASSQRQVGRYHQPLSSHADRSQSSRIRLYSFLRPPRVRPCPARFNPYEADEWSRWSTAGPRNDRSAILAGEIILF
jgi:hypothetical protein